MNRSSGWHSPLGPRPGLSSPGCGRRPGPPHGDCQRHNETKTQDITERKRVEETLRLLNSAVLQTREAVLITDARLDLPGPRIGFVNPAFTEMTGYTLEEVIGKTSRILQGARTDKTVSNRLRENLQQGEVFHGEAINYRKDGTEFEMELQAAPTQINDLVASQRDAVQPVSDR